MKVFFFLCERCCLSTDKHMKEKLLQLVDCGFFDHVPLPKVDSPEKTEAAKTDPPSKPCNLSSEIYSNLTSSF